MGKTGAQSCNPALPSGGGGLSGYGMNQDRDRSAESGFVRHLVKPVTIESRDAAIREVCA